MSVPRPLSYLTASPVSHGCAPTVMVFASVSTMPSWVGSNVRAGCSGSTFQSGIRVGAISEADSVTSSAAVTVESLITAVTSLAMTLPIAVTWTATPPEPDTPTARPRITDDDSEASATPPAVVSTVEPVIVVSMVFVMTLAASATPTAAPPLAETPNVRASITELSVAAIVICPTASTSDASVETTLPSAS